MADYGTSDTSTTSLGANQFPISDVYVPNTGLRATEGGPASTDLGGKVSAPTSMYIKDGSNVTQGAQADPVYTDGTGAASGTGMGLFKGIFVKLATIATAIVGTLKVKGDFAEQASLSAGSLNADLVPSTDVSGYKSLSLQIDGTAYSGTLTFAWSNDGSNFYPLVMTRIDSNGSNTTTTTSLNAVGFCTNVFFHYFRVRMTSYASGAAHGTLDLFTFPMTFVPVVDQGGIWTVQPGNTANTTPWLASDHDGTNKANNLAASSVSNALTNQSARLMAGAVQEISFTTTTVQAVGSTDVSNYRWISVMVGAQGTSSTVTFQASNDNSNWFSCILFGSSAAPSSGASSTTTTGMWHGPLPGRYFRLNVTGISAGTTSGVVELYTVPTTPHTIGASALQNGTWTVQPGNTQNTTPWLMAGPNANGTQAANSAANTVIKGSSGWLYHAIITTLGTAGLTIYDNASTNSGTPLLVIPASAAVGTIYSFPSGARAVNGITSAGVTNCPAVTFHYT